ncbi:hypothetical protein F5Y18DRAFT_409404 [Xylariaceae sp. FL1019]|nr:hypothetical protein F5Y18DRAFT_409404 [Xylariaceae sp. FL1019]
MSTPYIMSVVYPAGTKFDMDYYLATHMPLVQKKWAPYGLKAWKVHEYTTPDAAYTVQANLEWESEEACEKAKAAPEGAEVFGDVPNFSDKTPSVWGGDVKKSATC